MVSPEQDSIEALRCEIIELLLAAFQAGLSDEGCACAVTCAAVEIAMSIFDRDLDASRRALHGSIEAYLPQVARSMADG